MAGFDVRTQPGKIRARLGFLAAGTALYGRLTARETLAYFGRLNGLSDRQISTRVQKLATDLNMGDFLDRRVDTFSTGMKQKTSIARTLVHDPEVLIFDEPTLGLDVFAARAIRDSIRECRDAGKTIVYSTHVMSEVEKLCDVVGIIHRGRLVAEGTPAALKARFAADDMEEAFVSAVGNEPEVAAWTGTTCGPCLPRSCATPSVIDAR